MTVESNDHNDVGTYTATLTVSNMHGPVYWSEYEFEVTVEENPCRTTTLDDPVIEDMIAYV